MQANKLILIHFPFKTLRWLKHLEQCNDRSRSITNGKMSEESRLLLEEESRVRRILFGSRKNKTKKDSKNKHNRGKTRKLNEVPDYLRKRRRIAVEQGRGGDMAASNEDRERQAILEEAVEATEHDLEKFRQTAEEELIEEQGNEDRMYNTMFEASFIEEPRVVIKSLSSIDKTAVGLVLADLDPDYVVLYDFDISFVRSVEVFAALNPLKKENRLKVYFLMFAASSEQKVFQKALEREQSAFEKLIYHKKTMPPPVLQVEGTQEMQQALANGSVAGTYKNGTLPLSMDTRRGAGKSKTEKRDVAVDVREFRSALPSILHRGGMRLAPVTLLVGDFVLSNVHCVERKSISDLYGSFASGRLYVSAMCSYWATYFGIMV
jgi:DNA excision repair protein ERCC-4